MTKEEVFAYHRAYRLANRLKIAARAKDYQLKNKTTLNAAIKVWRQNNRPRINAKKVTKYKADVAYRLSLLLRTGMKGALKKNLKTGIAVEELGCTGPELRVYLESLFEQGMNWNNYGNKKGCWSIDHIVPVSSADLTNRDEYLKISHFRNLQPMWHVLHMVKSNTTDILLNKRRT